MTVQLPLCVHACVLLGIQYKNLSLWATILHEFLSFILIAHYLGYVYIYVATYTDTPVHR